MNPAVKVCHSWHLQAYCNKLFKIVPNFSCESSWIFSTLYNCGLNWKFLRYRASPEPETGTKWLVSLQALYIYIICMDLKSLQKTTFFDTICEKLQLTVSCFMCRTNWDSKSETKTTSKLISTPRIQWWSWICQKKKRYGWTTHFLM